MSQGQPATAAGPSSFDLALAEIKAAGYVVQTAPPKATVRQRIIMWLVASALAGLAPVGATALHYVDSGGLGFYQLFGKGDLLMVAVVLSLAGIGEIALYFRHVKTDALALGLLVVGLAMSIVVDAIWFSDLSALALAGKKGDPIATVTYGSIVLYGLAVLFSSYCVGLVAGVD